MWYTSGSGRIELQLTKQQAATGSHSGQLQPGSGRWQTGITGRPDCVGWLRGG